jgi:6-pyruvoyltetrahydropterin/6-carboxytetrahydropterin synthase
MSRHRILLARDSYKFSAAHMTVFPDGTKERLHGHNYTFSVELEVDRVDFASMIPFSAVKGVLAALAAEWKERVFLAISNPFFRLVRDTGNEYEFTVCNQRYVLPRADVLMLPIDNISVEALSAHVASVLAERMPREHILAITVKIEESPGQGAATTLDLTH